MKGKIVLSVLLLTVLALGGCGQRKTSQPSADDEHIIYVSEVSQTSMGNKVIEKPVSPQISVPEGSISLKDACKLLDTCTKHAFYLAESMSSYQKYCFGIVDYQGSSYYSIYPYLETAGKRVYVGTNCLVALDGSAVMAANWMGSYDTVQTNTAGSDKDIRKMYPDAKITPNEAFSVLAQKESVLGLERPLADYVFEIDEKLIEAGSVPCYCITPKLEYTDHIDLLKVYYITADGKGSVLSTVKGSPTEYSELK